MTMPINIRNDATADLAGNQFAPARFPVPIDIDDPVERMQAIRELVAQQRGEPALGLAEPLAAVLNRLPTTVSTGVFGSMLRGVDFVTRNVPGAPIPVFLAGARMEAQFPFGPLSGAADQHHAAELPRRGAHRRQHRPGGDPRPRRLPRVPRGGLRRGPARSGDRTSIADVARRRRAGPAGAAAAITLARAGPRRRRSSTRRRSRATSAAATG